MVDDEGDALIFRARWSNDVEQTEQDIVYIYRNLHAPERMEFREIPFDEFAERFGLKLTALRRIRIGRIAMAGLPPGQWRYLPPGERF